jgi:bacteriocin resistance YdeI/OmpD-like protein
MARAAYDRLAHSHKRQHVHAIESAKKPETRTRRIEKAVAMLREQEAAAGRAALVKAESTKSNRPHLTAISLGDVDEDLDPAPLAAAVWTPTMPPVGA